MHGNWVCDDFATMWCEVVQIMPHPRPGTPNEMFVEIIGQPATVKRFGDESLFRPCALVLRVSPV